MKNSKKNIHKYIFLLIRSTAGDKDKILGAFLNRRKAIQIYTYLKYSNIDGVSDYKIDKVNIDG